VPFVIIRQCIPADRATTAAFLQRALTDLPAAPDLARFELELSLIAGEGETTQGVALCRMVAGKACELVVVTLEPLMTQTLIDKAMAKLHARGIHKCRVSVLRGETGAVWEQTRWAGAAAVI
jgi:hypothetical protein